MWKLQNVHDRKLKLDRLQMAMSLMVNWRQDHQCKTCSWKLNIKNCENRNRWNFLSRWDRRRLNPWSHSSPFVSVYVATINELTKNLNWLNAIKHLLRRNGANCAAPVLVYTGVSPVPTSFYLGLGTLDQSVVVCHNIHCSGCKYIHILYLPIIPQSRT